MKFLKKTAMLALGLGLGLGLLATTSGCDEFEEAAAWTAFEQDPHLGNGPSPNNPFDVFLDFL